MNINGPNVKINYPFVTYVGYHLIVIVTAEQVSFYNKIEDNFTLSAMKAKLENTALQPRILQFYESHRV